MNDFEEGERYEFRFSTWGHGTVEATVLRAGLHDLTIGDITIDDQPVERRARTQIIGRHTIDKARLAEVQIALGRLDSLTPLGRAHLKRTGEMPLTNAIPGEPEGE